MTRTHSLDVEHAADSHSSSGPGSRERSGRTTAGAHLAMRRFKDLASDLLRRAQATDDVAQRAKLIGDCEAALKRADEIDRELATSRDSRPRGGDAIERRSASPVAVETRRLAIPPAQSRLAVSDTVGGGQTLSGYAAVFYTPADSGSQFQLWRGVYERVSPKAFDRSLREKHDVRALFNHDGNLILGRTSSGTLRLKIDSVGLKFDLDLPDHHIGHMVRESVARGDLSGCSFAFVPVAESWQTLANGDEIRTLDDVDLIDVGPVTYPAYTATSVGVRETDPMAIADKIGRDLARDRAAAVQKIAIDTRANRVKLDQLSRA